MCEWTDCRPLLAGTHLTEPHLQSQMWSQDCRILVCAHAGDEMDATVVLSLGALTTFVLHFFCCCCSDKSRRIS